MGSIGARLQPEPGDVFACVGGWETVKQENSRMLSVSGSVETTLTPLYPPFRGGEECKNVAVRVCELAFVGKSRRMEIFPTGLQHPEGTNPFGICCGCGVSSVERSYTYRIELCLMFTPFGSRNAGAQIKSVVTFRCLACWFLSEGWEGTNFRMRLVPVC